jgi:hypothetical protein
MGYKNVAHYPEGKQGWMEAGLPVAMDVYDRSNLQDFEQALGQVVGSQLLPSCDPKLNVQ